MNYELNPYLSDIILSKSGSEKLRWFINVFTELDKINNTPQPNDSFFDLPLIEDDLVNSLIDEDICDIVILLEERLKEIIVKGMERNGIILNPEIENRVILGILEGYTTLTTLDVWLSEPIMNFINSLESDEKSDPVYIFSLCISEYSTLTTQEVYENIEDIGDNVLKHIATLIEEENDGDPEEDEDVTYIETMNKLMFFYNITPEIMSTNVMRTAISKRMINRSLREFVPYMLPDADLSFSSKALEIVAGLILTPESHRLRPEEIIRELKECDALNALNVEEMVGAENKIVEIYNLYRRK